MKKLVLLLLLFTSCTRQIIPLKHTYTAMPFELTTHSDFEAVWQKIIEVSAKKGSVAKLIDKSSGLLVAQNTYAPLTTENTDHTLVDSGAWAIAQKLYHPGSRKYGYPKEGTIEWNVHVKRGAGNTAIISISLVDMVTVTSVYSPGFAPKPAAKPFKTKAFTTGVFEKQMAEAITAN